MTEPQAPDVPADGRTEPMVTVKTLDNGPLQIEGPLQVVDHEGTAYGLGDQQTAYLCRCGGSSNKPFCDGTHASTGFEAGERSQRQGR